MSHPHRIRELIYDFMDGRGSPNKMIHSYPLKHEFFQVTMRSLTLRVANAQCTARGHCQQPSNMATLRGKTPNSSSFASVIRATGTPLSHDAHGAVRGAGASG